MTTCGAPTALFRLLAGALLAAGLLAGCKDKEAPALTPAPKPAVQPKATPLVTRDQAIASLLALPEVKAWSHDIEKRSRGKAHGAILEYDPAPRTINGRQYWQLSFVENHKDNVHRRESFLVAKNNGEILVEDVASDAVISLDDWRRGIRRVEAKSAD
ncbi:hypothetical protein G4G28_20045 [Massilia sp. Dwa41.01b]|uniref:hypothetical protein n=1 Tax=Massilia sp. Dwa41.01b TaxID=2709302 RepID=UPI0015FF5F87|nr:hypothetical protein [Massilia sp. Dwa41.01b]QNA90219.1 hypothetical protein G4G28_20045 [Massilia sp. Dwa41.01b]